MKRTEIRKGEEKLVSAIDACTFFLRLRGLLGRSLEDGEGLLLTPCDQIHTFGMSYPIDTVYLSREGSVLKVEAAVPAGKACRRVKGAHSVLELPAGCASRLGLAAGDTLTRA